MTSPVTLPKSDKRSVQRALVEPDGERLVIAAIPPDLPYGMQPADTGPKGVLVAAGVDPVRAALIMLEFDESKHPRVPAGSPGGGRFGSGDGGGAITPMQGNEKVARLLLGDAYGRPQYRTGETGLIPGVTDKMRSDAKAETVNARAADLVRMLDERPELKAEYEKQMEFKYPNGHTEAEMLTYQAAFKAAMQASEGYAPGWLTAEAAIQAGSADNWKPVMDWAEENGKSRPLPELWAESSAQRYVDSWTNTAADSSGMALALQTAVKDELDSKSASFDEYSSMRTAPHTYEQMTQTLGDEGQTMRAFVRASYDATQKQLADIGLKPTDTVNLYRGMEFTPVGSTKGQANHPPENFPTGALDPSTGERVFRAEIPVDLNPASSWTTDLRVANAPYFSGDLGYILTDAVPVSDIISTPRSGMGALHEAEVIVRNRPGQTVDVIYKPGNEMA